MSVQARHTVTVAAPADAVMAVVADIARQPEWWPGMLGSEVLEQDADGRVLRARIVNDVKVVTDTFEVAYHHAEDGLSWELQGTSRAQRSQRGAWEVLATAPHECEVTLELTIEAILPLPKLVQRRVVTDAVRDAAEGLRRRCEQGAT